MRRLTVLLVILAAIILFAAPAQATTMKQWKQALENATLQYLDTWEATTPDNRGISVLLPGFNPETDGWGMGAQAQCCYVLSLYGEFPCDGLDWQHILSGGNPRLLPHVKDFLRPYLPAQGILTPGGMLLRHYLATP